MVSKLKLLGLFMLVILDLNSCSFVPIKELLEPRNFPPAGQQQNPMGPMKWVQANPAVCPSHLVQGLRGRCFDHMAGHYEYRLCPFDNATQRDVAFRMLAIYHGIVGVWDGWRIDNGSFIAMAMPNGDPCPGADGADGRRRTLVRLRCANATWLESVQESPVCQYNMVLATPLVCHPQAMLVYPCLAHSHRLAWDAIYTMRRLDIVNETGYSLLVDNLLLRAQLLSADPGASTGHRAPSPPRQLARGPLSPAGDGQLMAGQNRKQSLDFLAEQIASLQKLVRQGRPAAANPRP